VPVRDLGKYVRVLDFSGELWTIPSGTDLHRALAIDVALGNPTPVLPVELCRNPSLAGLQSYKPSLNVPDKMEFMIGGQRTGQTNRWAAVAKAILLVGDYLRLRERVLDRQPAEKAAK
jgi:hypothetical protein